MQPPSVLHTCRAKGERRSRSAALSEIRWNLRCRRRRACTRRRCCRSALRKDAINSSMILVVNEMRSSTADGGAYAASDGVAALRQHGPSFDKQ